VSCYCDYDPPSFYEAAIHKARKQYKCSECAGYVWPGEPYERAAGLWEGTFWHWKTCERCYDIRMWVQNNVPCFCFAHGGLDETAEEAIEEAYSRARNEVVGLRFGYLRRKVKRLRFNIVQKAKAA
jgi:hypothetical protein